MGNEAMNTEVSDKLMPPGPPEIAINGPKVRIDWLNADYAGGMTNIDYSISVLTSNGTFEEVWCEDFGTLVVSRADTMTCNLDTAALMSEPFGLYYGDSVYAKIHGSNQEDHLMSEVGTSENLITPYIAG